MLKPFIQVKELTKHYQMGGTTVLALDGLNSDIERAYIHRGDGAIRFWQKHFTLSVGWLRATLPSGGFLWMAPGWMKWMKMRWRSFAERRWVSFFSLFNLIPSMSALDNVAFPCNSRQSTLPRGGNWRSGLPDQWNSITVRITVQLNSLAVIRGHVAIPPRPGE